MSSLGREVERPKGPGDLRQTAALIQSSAGPEWRLNVRALGFANPHRPESSRGPFPGNPAWYVENSQIVVTFVRRVETTGLSERGRPDASLPFRIHALFVDSMTGKVNADREWPTASAQSCLVRSSGGGFVVFTPDKLLLYSPSGELLKELNLPLRSDATWESWELHPSPRGRYLLVTYDAKSNARSEDALDHATATRDNALVDRILAEAEEGEELIDLVELKILRIWKIKFGPDYDFLPASISDEGLLVLRDKVERFDHSTLPLSTLEPSLGHFINDQLLVKWRWKLPRLLGFDLHDTQGRLLHREDFHDRGDIIARLICRSSGGQRLAIAFEKGKGGIKALDIGAHYSLERIVLFDVPSGQWVYRLDGKRERITSLSALALSGDGSQLALIDQDGVLKVYRLPEEK